MVPRLTLLHQQEQVGVRQDNTTAIIGQEDQHLLRRPRRLLLRRRLFACLSPISLFPSSCLKLVTYLSSVCRKVSGFCSKGVVKEEKNKFTSRVAISLPHLSTWWLHGLPCFIMPFGSGRNYLDLFITSCFLAALVRRKQWSCVRKALFYPPRLCL